MEAGANFTIRTVQISDLPFLSDMLYEAAAVAESMRILGKEKALSLPVKHTLSMIGPILIGDVP